MAYSSTNPPCILTSGSFGGQSLRMWGYKSTDAVATVAGSSYFSNGASLGMRIGDFVGIVQLSTAGAFTAYNIACVSSRTTGAGATINTVSSST